MGVKGLERERGGYGFTERVRDRGRVRVLSGERELDQGLGVNMDRNRKRDILFKRFTHTHKGIKWRLGIYIHAQREILRDMGQRERQRERERIRVIGLEREREIKWGLGVQRERNTEMGGQGFRER